MRYSMFLLLTVVSLGVADDRTAKEIVERAIKAHGGKETLLKLRAYRYLSRGIIKTPDGKELTTENETWHEPLVCARSNMVIEVGDKKHHCAIIIDGAEGWSQIDRTTQNMSAAEWLTAQEKLYHWRLASLYPLIEDESFTLTPCGERIIEGRPVVGVRISSKIHLDVDFYFAKATDLLAGIESKETIATGEKLTVLTAFSAHKGFDGLQFPTRISRSNGAVVTTENVIEFTPLRELDRKLSKRVGE